MTKRRKILFIFFGILIFLLLLRVLASIITFLPDSYCSKIDMGFEGQAAYRCHIGCRLGRETPPPPGEGRSKLPMVYIPSGIGGLDCRGW